MSIERYQDDDVFLAGLIAGEGCFRVDLHQNSRMACGVRFTPELVIRLHENDSELLDTIVELYGIGSCHSIPQDNTYVWRVSGFKQCYKIIDIIDSVDNRLFKTSLKADSYDIWKKFILSYESPKTKKDAMEYIKIVCSINPIGRKGRGASGWFKKLGWQE